MCLRPLTPHTLTFAYSGRLLFGLSLVAADPSPNPNITSDVATLTLTLTLILTLILVLVLL